MEDAIIVELKSIDAIALVHEAQILMYMKFAQKKIGLFINFNVLMLKYRIRRFIK